MRLTQRASSAPQPLLGTAAAAAGAAPTRIALASSATAPAAALDPPPQPKRRRSSKSKSAVAPDGGGGPSAAAAPEQPQPQRARKKKEYVPAVGTAAEALLVALYLVRGCWVAGGHLVGGSEYLGTPGGRVGQPDRNDRCLP